MQEVADITRSEDAEAGLTADNLGIQVESVIEQVTAKEAEAKATLDGLESAHPGAAWTGNVAADHMQASLLHPYKTLL